MNDAWRETRALLRHLPGPWVRDAACANVDDPGVFFVDRGGTSGLANARSLCANCPVQPECLSYAISNCEDFGMWGGLTRKERLVVSRNRAEAKKCQRCGLIRVFTKHSMRICGQCKRSESRN